MATLLLVSRVPKENASATLLQFLGAVFTGPLVLHHGGGGDSAPALTASMVFVVRRVELTRASHLFGTLSTVET